jgi:hypothetical protein
MRHALIALSLLLGTVASAPPALGQVSIGISIPGVSIGIYQPVYPELVLVPGYPVYYAPRAHTNYFFYDGLYWVYHDDHWYSSAWYDGPWDLVDPYYVPLFVLRVPVRYYVRPPVYFHGWVVMAPPRWDLHWGPRWAQHRRGWDHWDRRVAWAPAPPPRYQRNYHGEHYPRPEPQRARRDRHYRYEPRDADVRQYYHQRQTPRSQAPGQQGRPEAAHAQNPQRQRDAAEQRPAPEQHAPRQRGSEAYGHSQPPRQDRQERQENERRAQIHVQPVPRVERAAPQSQSQPMQGPREDMQRPPPAQAASRQRGPAMQEPQHQPPRVQQAPGSQQAREPRAQGRSADQSGGNPERRQGPWQDRGR